MNEYLSQLKPKRTEIPARFDYFWQWRIEPELLFQLCQNISLFPHTKTYKGKAEKLHFWLSWTLAIAKHPPDLGYEYWRSDIMAKFGNMQAVNIQLTQADKAPLEKFAEGYKYDVVHAINQLGGSGIKVSITWVDDSNSWCVTLTGSPSSKHNKDRFMSSWSDDWVEALFMGLYKHEVVCDNGSWVEHATSAKWG